MPQQANYPQCLIDGSASWGVWVLAIDEAGEAFKKQVPLTGRLPNVSKPETLVDFQTANRAVASILSRPADLDVLKFLKDNTKASRCGLIWLIQPGFIVLDYDGMKDNPSYNSLYMANPTWTEYSSRGDGIHQVFSHPANVAGVISKVVDGIDARGSGSFLYMTGRSNPNWPDVVHLTPYFEEVITAKAKENAIARAQASSRRSFVGEEVSDEYVVAKFSEDLEALTYASDPEQQLNSDVMRVFVQRLARYSSDATQMRRIFCQFPCADESNITKPKRKRKITDVISLFDLHYDNMLKNNSLELPMVQFNLSMGQEVVELLPALDTEELLSEEKYEAPKLPPNMQVLADALNMLSEVACDVAPPSVVQLTRMLAGDRLLTEAVYLTMGKKLRVAAINTRPIVHFFTLANSGRGKSRAYRRIREFGRMVTQQLQGEGYMNAIPLYPVRDMGKGLQGANKLAASLALFEKQLAGIGLTDEAEANFATSTDPGGAKAFLKEFTENVCSPGATTIADKNNSSNRVELQDYVVQLSYLSTIKAIKPVLMQHLGDGLLARLVLWISNEPAIDASSWDGTVEESLEDERVDLTQAITLVKRYITAPSVTVKYPVGIFNQCSGLFRRMLQLGSASAGIDSDSEEDAFNRYVTYAQYLSAIYAWSESPEDPSHTVESLEWGVSFMEFVKKNAIGLFKSISRTVDATTHQAKHALNSVNHSAKYEAAIVKFYTEGTELALLREVLKKNKRLSTVTEKNIESRILSVGMINQYTLKFFGLSRVESATKVRDEALRGLVSQGIVELQSAAGMVLGNATTDLPSDTRVFLVKQAEDSTVTDELSGEQV